MPRFNLPTLKDTLGVAPALGAISTRKASGSEGVCWQLAQVNRTPVPNAAAVGKSAAVVAPAT
ncbi:MAG: hypothetical protein WAN72_17590 [Candidatus Acidiferrales bacterium]